MDPAADLILRLLLALVLFAAASHKLRDPAAFRDTLDGYRLLPASLAATAAWLVVAAEIVAGTMLLGVASRAAAAIAAAGLLAVYGLAIGVNLARGRRDIDCGCLGPGRSAGLSGWLVARNALLAAAALAGLVPLDGRPLGWLDALTVAGATVVLAACWLAAADLLAVRPAAARLRSAA